MSKAAKYIEKLAIKKEKAEKKWAINPYLAAGLPLTIATGLGLRGSVPASKLGVKLLKSKVTKKPYLPGEFVQDYLDMSHGMGKTKLNPILKRIHVRAKKTLEEQLDEAVHWDEFTKDPKAGLARWLFEVEREASPERGGNIIKQKRLRESLKKFNDSIKGDPSNIPNIAEDKNAQMVLARMAKMHAPWGEMHSRVGLAGLGAFGGGLALTGKGIYDELNEKKAEDHYESLDDSENLNNLKNWATGGIGVGALGLAAGQLEKAKKLTGSKTIGVTAGRLNKPIVESSIGGGHEAPMEAIYEALANHPAIQAGEFNLDKLLRTNEGMTEKFQHTGKNPSKNWLTTVETGFGGTMWPAFGLSKFKDSPVYHNPYGQVLFLPDAPQKDKFFKYIHSLRNANALDKHLGEAGQDLITFGPDYHGDYRDQVRLFNSPVAHPAVADKTIADAERRLAAGTDREGTLRKLMEVAEKGGDQRTVDAIKKAISENKKIYTISGATRGDQVASRTVEFIEALKKNKMHEDALVLSLLGENKGTPLESLLNNLDNVAAMPKLDRELFINAQNIADAHWASPGASSQAEAMMSPVLTATSEYTAPEREREIDMLRRGGVLTPELEDSLRRVDMDNWSPGNRRWLKQRSKHKAGIGAIHTADDFIDFIKNNKNLPKEQLIARAKDYMLESREMKARMADAIVNRARLAKKMSQKGATIANVLGGAGLLGGGSLIFNAIRDHLKHKKDRKETYPEFLYQYA
jgi:hypothetical protein